MKWHGIRTGEVVPPALTDAIVATIANSLIRCYVTLLDIELGSTTPEFFATDEDTYATGMMFLAERFQLLLESTDDVGLIVVDSRFREDNARLRRFFADLTKDGSPYSRLDRIVEGLFLGPSHYSIGLQCADPVCAITAAAERGNGQAGYLKTLLLRFATHPATGSSRRRWHQALPRASAARTEAAQTVLAREGGLIRRPEDGIDFAAKAIGRVLRAAAALQTQTGPKKGVTSTEAGRGPFFKYAVVLISRIATTPETGPQTPMHIRARVCANPTEIHIFPTARVLERIDLRRHVEAEDGLRVAERKLGCGCRHPALR